MRKKIKLFILMLFLAYVTLTNNLSSIFPHEKVLNQNSYAEENEFIKGIWVSTVHNLDFPNYKTQDSLSLKKEIDTLTDNVKNLGFNTIFFQVRPSADAIYKSDIFPWSSYLTGNLSKAPDNNFDPFEYLIKVAHKKGLKIHAWVNPYRVTASYDEKNNLSDESIGVKYKDLVLEYKGKLYLNPGLPEANNLVADGIYEIVKNYAVDGIQIDDYFYPGTDFPDDWSYSVYGKNYDNKDDWRRDNITSLIDKIRQSIQKENKNVLFGVSPQGIWANKDNISTGSATNGDESYFSAYADTKKWVKENKIDYIIPQIYWNIGYAGADFKVIADWWDNLVKDSNVKLVIGQAAYKVAECDDPESVWFKENGATELTKQYNIIKNMKNCSGYSMFRYSSIINNEILSNALIELNSGKKQIFDDISGVIWAKDDIISLYEKGIITGYDNGSFYPNQYITRAEFATIVSRLLNKNEKIDENFIDVAKDEYYYTYVGTLKNLNYIKGREDNKFYPKENISRQDTSLILYRILKGENIITDKEISNTNFKDDKEVSTYAYNAIYQLNSYGLLNGYEDSTIKPKKYITRAECAVLINKIFNLK